MAMGGYMAEKLVFGDITAGSASDIKQASSIARRMVTEWGMSAKIGPVFLGGAQEVFIGRTYGQTHNYSETVATLVDEEVRLFIQEAMDTASEAIRSHMDKLKRLSSLLLEREKINGNEFRMIMKGEELPQEKENNRKRKMRSPSHRQRIPTYNRRQLPDKRIEH